MFLIIFKRDRLDTRYCGRFFKAAAVFAVGVAPQLKVTLWTTICIAIWVNPNLGRLIFNFSLPGQHQRAAIGNFIGDVADIIQAGVVALDVVVIAAFAIARPISIQRNLRFLLPKVLRFQVIMNAFSVPAVSDRVDQREGVLAISIFLDIHCNVFPAKRFFVFCASLIAEGEMVPQKLL